MMKLERITVSILIMLTVHVHAQNSNINVWKDVVMTAQGNSSQPSTASFFVGETGAVVGSCEVKSREATIDFIAYCNNAAVFSFYSPESAVNIAKNFKCKGESWLHAGNLKSTKFRVLVPGTNTVDLVYKKYNAGILDKLDESVFSKLSEVRAGGIKFDADKAKQTSNTFNTTSAYLIWIRVPQNGEFKNGLMRVKEVNVTNPVGQSSIKFDIMLQK